MLLLLVCLILFAQSQPLPTITGSHPGTSPGKVGDGTCVYNGKVISGCFVDVFSPDEFIQLSNRKNYVKPTVPPSRTVTGPGSKILFDFRDPTVVRQRTWYIDTARYPSHSNFLTEMGELAEWSARPRNWFRCDWQSYVDTNNDWYFAITINVGYAVASDMIKLLCRNAAVGLHMRKTFKNGWLSIDPTTQKFDQSTIDYCASFGLQVMDIDDLFEGKLQSFYPMHTGEAYGILKMFPAPEALLSPKDIPVFNFLPLDLSVVQGTVTSVYQTTNSHINLKSNERNTPNMILLNIAAFPCFTALNGKPVRIQVSSVGWAIEAATQQQVDNWYSSKLLRNPWLYLVHDPYAHPRSFTEMCGGNDASHCIENYRPIFGTKAASLGFLRHSSVLGTVADKGSLSNQYGFDVTVPGFGVPMQFYIDYVNYPPNAAIRKLIDKMTADEMSREVDEVTRARYSDELRELFWKGTIPPHVYNAVLEKCYEVFYPLGMTRIKLRSSSNAEDLPGFDGAGLYDSFPCDYTKPDVGNDDDECHYDPVADAMSPDTLNCALKGVYGSLWNLRAIAERTYAKFVHSTCAMGIAVNPQYTELGKVVGNAVVITKNIEPGIPVDTPTYTFSIQEGDNDVTNPDPGTSGEGQVYIFEEDPSKSRFLLTKYATPVAGQLPLRTQILSQKLMNQMRDIAIRAEYAYCTSVWDLSPADCSLANRVWNKTGIDLEYKFVRLDDTGEIVTICKQLREFSGGGVPDTIINITGPCKEISPLYFPQPPGPALVNVALNKVATSSATHLKGLPQKGIDDDATGDLYNSALVATNGTQRWWQVDLLKNYDPKYVRIYNLASPYSTQMNNFNLQFLDDKGAVIKTVAVTGQGTRPILTFNNTDPALAKTRVLRMVQPNSLANPVLAFSEIQIWSQPSSVSTKPFPRAVRPVTPNACVWNAWGTWSTCTKTCGSGSQNRTRGPDYCIRYTTEPHVETRDCNTAPCAMNCIGEWSSWSVCDCQNSTFSTYRVVKPAMYGGKCEATNGQIRTQRCDWVGCPVPCVGNWTVWGACSCFTSTQVRLYIVSQPALNGGPCPLSGEVENRDCNPTDCQVDTSTGSISPEPSTKTFTSKVSWVYKNGAEVPSVAQLKSEIESLLGSSVTVEVSITEDAPIRAYVTLTSGSEQLSQQAADEVSRVKKQDPNVEPDSVSNEEASSGGMNIGIVVGVAVGVFVGALLLGIIIVYLVFPKPQPAFQTF